MIPMESFSKLIRLGPRLTDQPFVQVKAGLHSQPFPPFNSIFFHSRFLEIASVDLPRPVGRLWPEKIFI